MLHPLLLIQASFVHESPPLGTEWRKPNLLRLHSIVYILRSIVVIRLIIHELASNEHCYRVIKLIRWLYWSKQNSKLMQEHLFLLFLLSNVQMLIVKNDLVKGGLLCCLQTKLHARENKLQLDQIISCVWSPHYLWLTVTLAYYCILYI